MTRWAWFGAWVLVGASAALALISFVIPFFVIPIVLGGVLIWRRESHQSAVGAVSGAGFLFLYVAYVQRDGPGTTCTSLPHGGQQCDEHLNPLPWLVLGILLVVAGVAIFARVSRRSA